jgi:hypothetical protein
MRVGLMLVGVTSMLIGIFAACSSFTASDDPQAVTEAGADGAAPDAAAATDGALLPTPGKVDCFGTTCSTEMNNTCCVEPDAGTTSCTSTCPQATLAFRCDDKSDCAPGRFCCVGFFGDTSCMATCSDTGERLCHADSECERGSTCLQVPCRGTVIGVCGPVGNYVKSFCNVQ